MAAGQSLADHDASFHLAVCEATHNQFLVRTANWFYLVSGSRRQVYFSDSRNARRSHTQHVGLRNALAAHDAPRALALMKRHLGGVERYWLSTLQHRDTLDDVRQASQ
jgi:DNA-binding FadR family transcriptional regulator